MSEGVGTLTAFLDARCSHLDCKDKGAYRMVGYCMNCASQGILGMFTEGHQTSNFGPCPLCGVNSRLGWKRLATADEIPAAVQPVSA